LVVAVVAVRSYSSREAEKRGCEPHLAVVFSRYDERKNGGEGDARRRSGNWGKHPVNS
jgi:hypothetical protein